MKIFKKNKDNRTKDVLLHQIFDEISEENKEINADGYLDEIIPIPTTKLWKIREIQKKRQWFFIALLVVSIIYVLFNTDRKTQKTEIEKVEQVEEKKHFSDN